MYAKVTERLFGEPSAPVRIGRYRVVERLGSGAMGVVYGAVDERLGRKLAIKLLHDSFNGDPTGRARLLREAQAMARLRHENVVLVYDVGTHGDGDEQVFIAMELVEGRTLELWRREAPRSPDEILACYYQAGKALAAAHRAGVLHRDFKPKSRRPSQTAPQPTDRPHSHSQGRFERVDVYRAAPGRSGVPQVLAKRWQRAGPPEDQRGHAPRHSQGRHHEPFPSHPFATAAPRAAAGR